VAWPQVVATALGQSAPDGEAVPEYQRQ